MRHLRQSASALESFVTSHLQYQHADDIRMVNSVSVHFDSLLARLVYSSMDIMDRYQRTRRGGFVLLQSSQCDAQDTDVLLAVDLSKLLSHIRTASQIISLAR